MLKSIHMMRCIFCVLASYFVFSMVAVFAQTSETNSDDVNRRIVYREKSYYDFEDTLIRGDRLGPEGTSINRKQATKFKSSLNLSKSHLPALEDSAVEAR